MLVNVYNLDKNAVGEADLPEEVFFTHPRIDIMHSVVNWQLSNRRSGTRKTRTISDVSGTTKKPFKQKGTGNARQGSLRSVHMRGGAVSHGPVVRSHGFSLPKKIRQFGMRSALSEKCMNDRLFVVDSFVMSEISTSDVKKRLGNFGYKSYLIIDDSFVDFNFMSSVRNLHGIDVLPQVGANVYDILRHDCVLISVPAVESLSWRLR
jgi:large subunit ribosomal protein L4